MPLYSKDIFLHNINIKLASNDSAFTKQLSGQLRFPKFRKYPDYIKIKINVILAYSPQEGERGDIFDTADNNFSLNCWLKNINIRIDKKTNSVYARVLLPNALGLEALLHLIVIEPMRYLLKLKDIFLIHSAAMKKKNSGLLICGGPSAGKSTLAATLLAKGYEFLSDEFSILSKGSIYSFPLEIKLDKNKFKARSVAEYFRPRLTLFIFKARSRAKTVGIRRLSQEESFMFLVSDRNNCLAYEKNPILRKKQIQALSFIARTTKSYALTYRLNNINRACQAIDRLI